MYVYMSWVGWAGHLGVCFLFDALIVKVREGLLDELADQPSLSATTTID